MLNIKFLPAFLLIPFFSFGFLVSCDSVSGAEKDEKSEYINSITSEDFQSAEEQKLVDNYSVPEDGFYTCGSYDIRGYTCLSDCVSGYTATLGDVPLTES